MPAVVCKKCGLRAKVFGDPAKGLVCSNCKAPLRELSKSQCIKCKVRVPREKKLCASCRS